MRGPVFTLVEEGLLRAQFGVDARERKHVGCETDEGVACAYEFWCRQHKSVPELVVRPSSLEVQHRPKVADADADTASAVANARAVVDEDVFRLEVAVDVVRIGTGQGSISYGHLFYT